MSGLFSRITQRNLLAWISKRPLWGVLIFMGVILLYGIVSFLELGGTSFIDTQYENCLCVNAESQCVPHHWFDEELSETTSSASDDSDAYTLSKGYRLPLPLRMRIFHHKGIKNRMAHDVHYCGVYQPCTSWVMFNILRDRCMRDKHRMNFIDIGAGTGYYTVMAAQYGCNVYSFEFNPRLWEGLERTIKRSGVADRIHFHKLALTDKKRTVLYVQRRDGSVGNVSPIADDMPEIYNDTSISQIEKVPGRPLSDFITDDVLMMRVNVAGYEDKVLEGAMGLFNTSRVDHIIMEIGDRNPEKQHWITWLLSRLYPRYDATIYFEHTSWLDFSLEDFSDRCGAADWRPQWAPSSLIGRTPERTDDWFPSKFVWFHTWY